MTHRTVTHVIPARTMSEGVGAIVHRTIGAPGFDHLDPFLLLDEFTSTGGKEGGGFPDHPHRGFETVTYMLDGRIEHADNKGHKGVIGPGGIQWMTAGSGLVHSEMPANEAGEPIRGMQLWVNLPAKDKMRAPRYQELEASAIPSVALGDAGSVKVIAGSFDGTAGPVQEIATAPLYLDVELEPGKGHSFALPADHRAFAYGLRGSAQSGEVTFGERDLAIFSEGDTLDLKAGPDGARFILVAAAPLGEPIARYGPFVMNTREEIMTAFEDFREGRF